MEAGEGVRPSDSYANPMDIFVENLSTGEIKNSKGESVEKQTETAEEAEQKGEEEKKKQIDINSLKYKDFSEVGVSIYDFVKKPKINIQNVGDLADFVWNSSNNSTFLFSNKRKGEGNRDDKDSTEIMSRVPGTMAGGAAACIVFAICPIVGALIAIYVMVPDSALNSLEEQMNTMTGGVLDQVRKVAGGIMGDDDMFLLEDEKGKVLHQKSLTDKILKGVEPSEKRRDEFESRADKVIPNTVKLDNSMKRLNESLLRAMENGGVREKLKDAETKKKIKSLTKKMRELAFGSAFEGFEIALNDTFAGILDEKDSFFKDKKTKDKNGKEKVLPSDYKDLCDAIKNIKSKNDINYTGPFLQIANTLDAMADIELVKGNWLQDDSKQKPEEKAKEQPEEPEPQDKKEPIKPNSLKSPPSQSNSGNSL
jgi:hypothetical protein